MRLNPTDSGVLVQTRFYDGLDRVVRELLPDGSRTERIYGSWQVTEEVWEASSGLRERRRERVDGLGQLAAVDEWEHPTSPAPFTTSYLYDPFGQLAVVRNPVANDPALCNGHTASPACAGQSHEQRLFYGIRSTDPVPDTPNRLRESRWRCQPSWPSVI